MNIWQTGVYHGDGHLWQCVTHGQDTREKANEVALTEFRKSYPDAEVTYVGPIKDAE